MLEYTGNNLDVHLELAWKAAVKSFPTMAATYELANGAVHWTKEINGLEVEFLRSWEQLRDQAEYIFGDAARNLNDTGVAICASLKALAEADDEAGDIIDDVIKDGHPADVPQIDGTSIPLSGQYYTSDSYFTPAQPAINEQKNDAPSIEELLKKAAELEDKLFEAMCAEMDLVEGWIMSWFSRESLLDTADGPAIEENTGGVVDKIQSSTKYEPSVFDTTVGYLECITNTYNPFDGFRTEISNAKDGLNPDLWDSAAASSFREKFLNAYEDIAANHVALAGTLHGTIEGYRDALVGTYQTYQKILQEGIDACDALIAGAEKRPLELATAALKAGITIFGAMKGGSGFGFALATEMIEISSKAFSVGGSQTIKIRESVINAIESTRLSLDDLDQELSANLAVDYENVYNARHDPDRKIDLPKPEFTYYGAEPF